MGDEVSRFDALVMRVHEIRQQIDKLTRLARSGDLADDHPASGPAFEAHMIIESLWEEGLMPGRREGNKMIAERDKESRKFFKRMSRLEKKWGID